MAVVSILIVLLLIILVAVVSIIVYFFVYKRNINQRLQKMNKKAELENDEWYGKTEDSDRSKASSAFYEEPERKRIPALNAFAIGVVVASSWFCVLFCIVTVNNQTTNLQNSIMGMQSQVEELRETVERIAPDTDLSSASEGILSASIQYGNIYKEDQTADATITIQPEEMIPNSTAYLTYYGKQEKMEEKENGTYTATFRMPLFGESDDEDTYGNITYTLETEDGKKTMQILDNELEDDFYSQRFYRYLMTLSVEYDDCKIYGWKNNKLYVKGKMTAEAEPDCEDVIKDAKLVVRMNGDVMDQVQLGTLTNPGQEQEFELKTTYPDKGKDDQLDIYLETVDSYGYKFVYSFFGWSNGDDVYMTRVYDENGGLVYNGW
ncbi:MAG: hypothetical protein IJ661_08460 [Lachnospiraceae bacterium]|nr:hypothetical protein [Lachnospiraceae bacterium]